ncbi:uncharacterized protein ACA1_203640 [Acanthamoeba castellanii str. Neff]|uniref:Uncharacterized protein n=1 Tax=Acanthamoeba castellanii (strain ATCC 30010 / Neff) TaxID=1257118 RepID=L8GTI3_ACACF|nr:uncharacterized protein ACA1_203640 [Acanthamoeba castellanii str. Neff]ELR16320.1 hypothetical protein ACA1_203640 [Acanthamoeba castellanii str. Neff]
MRSVFTLLAAALFIVAFVLASTASANDKDVTIVGSSSAVAGTYIGEPTVSQVDTTATAVTTPAVVVTAPVTTTKSSGLVGNSNGALLYISTDSSAAAGLSPFFFSLFF